MNRDFILPRTWPQRGVGRSPKAEHGHDARRGRQTRSVPRCAPGLVLESYPLRVSHVDAGECQEPAAWCRGRCIWAGSRAATSSRVARPSRRSRPGSVRLGSYTPSPWRPGDPGARPGDRQRAAVRRGGTPPPRGCHHPGQRWARTSSSGVPCARENADSTGPRVPDGVTECRRERACLAHSRYRSLPCCGSQGHSRRFVSPEDH